MNEQDFDIRYTRIMDITHLRKWLQDPRVLQWFAMTTPQEIETALTGWIGFSRYSASITATVNRVPCGIATLFLMPYKKLNHHCFFKICVDPAFQRQGVGSSLIKNIKHLAATRFQLETLHVEVFGGNPLIPLLKKFDFHEFAEQKFYVKTEEGYKSRVLLETSLKDRGGYE